ncbi:hypothetical protein OCA8868_00545 [Octadecabacter ascidiaceicola]|uniref:Uncharacterized protein n=1 Tax=Octadecabacter ascidiaceicola TaxID=1655543 RepID=A0A238JPR1_9RHOB|nr:hypothetical protein OCA8868_00545 [Octadecabacter ascidiaceicola]
MPSQIRVSFSPQEFTAIFAPHLRHPFDTNPRFAHFTAQKEVEKSAAHPPIRGNKTADKGAARCRLTRRYPHRATSSPPPMGRSADLAPPSLSSSKTSQASNPDNPSFQKTPAPFLPLRRRNSGQMVRRVDVLQHPTASLWPFFCLTHKLVQWQPYQQFETSAPRPKRCIMLRVL